jgi:glycosyltransferase involved in cell wall biosynthesis
MVSIVFADTTGRYDGRDLERRALGGTESSVTRLARALVKRGHQVTVITNCDGVVEDHGVRWQPFSIAPPERCDLYVPIQHPKLLGLVPARRTALWVLWRPNNLKHYKQLPKMWWHRPVPILMSLFQVAQYSPVLPRRNPHLIIPLALPDDIRGLPPLAAPPPPVLVFASNPARNLFGIMRIFADRILPARPDAKLKVFGAVTPNADPWTAWGGLIPQDLSPQAKAAIDIRTAVPREQMMDEIRNTRAMIYLGHKTEAFCLSLAEAQALGVPCVVAPVAVLPERVIDGVTGFVHADDGAFAASALALLNDEALWRRQHEAALRLQQGLSWAEYAARFETALLSDWISTNRSWSAPVA